MGLSEVKDSALFWLFTLLPVKEQGIIYVERLKLCSEMAEEMCLSPKLKITLKKGEHIFLPL